MTWIPVLAGTALRNKGIHPLLDAVIAYLPSPADVPPVTGVDPRNTGEKLVRTPKNNDGNVNGVGSTFAYQNSASDVSWKRLYGWYKTASNQTSTRVTLTAVVEARAKATQMNVPANITENPQAFQQFQQNQSELSSALARLMVVVERYPDLKANQNFLSLQSQLEGTENRISVARRDYIQAVQKYNTELRTIPGRWVAGIFYPDAKVKETFAATAESQAAPKVNFQ